jgi:hypothetical protein
MPHLNFLNIGAAVAATILPVAVPPVNDTQRMFSWEMLMSPWQQRKKTVVKTEQQQIEVHKI